MERYKTGTDYNKSDPHIVKHFPKVNFSDTFIGADNITQTQCMTIVNN